MIVTLWRWAQGLNLPLRALVYISTAFIAGPGFLGFLSEYATYVYAMRVGIRPPVEGIPYLSATVTIASVAIALSVSLVFYATLSLVRNLAGLARFAEKVGKAARREAERKFSKHPGIALLLILIITLLSLVYATTRLYEHLYGVQPRWLLYLTSGYAVTTALGTIAAVDKRFAWWAAAVLAILFYIGTLSALFSREYYSDFLRTVGFGGGIYVSVSLKDRPEPLQMILDIRSSAWLIGRHSSLNGHLEIPIENVQSIRYIGTASAR